MSKKSNPKPLSGGTTVSARSITGLESSLLNVLSTTTTTVTLNNVNITGGQINGVILGEIQTGQGFFTSLQVGKPDGTGGQVCFYGNSVGDSACWLPITGTWDIRGDLSVRDISDLGNLRFSINTISSTNTNGNITISPNNTGTLIVTSGINLNTTNGNILFSSNNGIYSLNSFKNTLNSTKNTDLSTTDGSINLSTGISISTKQITFISTGAIVTVSTNTIHQFSIGNTLIFSGTNSTPSISGVYKINSIVSTTSFTIIPGFIVTNVGNTGFVRLRNDINLNAYDTISVPENIPIELGKVGNNIYNIANDIYIDSIGDINLNPLTNINIPINKFLTFGNNSDITNDGTNLIINCDNKLLINGDFHVNGTFTRLETEITTIKDPVITIGGVDPPLISDIKDRGIEYRYHDGVSSKIGFFGKKTSTGCFTYIPDATNTNEVFTGTPGCVQFGTTNVTNLIASGTISGTVIPTIERLSSNGGGFLNPSSTIETTFINITSSGIVTGVLPINTVDGYTKKIFLSSCAAGGEYRLACPSGRLLDPGSGTTASKTLKFSTAGQSINLIWDDVIGAYIIINAGVCIF